MSSPAALRVLAQIVHEETNSLVRYVIEVSKPPLVKPEDYKALACFQDLYRESERGIVALERLASSEAVVTRRIHWPLNYTSYNFLRPVYLLRPVVEDGEKHVAKLEALSAALAKEAWKAATAAVAELLEHERENLIRIRKLAEEYGEMSIDEPQVKGTSASRW